MEQETGIAIVIREDLKVWQKLNVTAFTIGGIAGIPVLRSCFSGGVDDLDAAAIFGLPFALPGMVLMLNRSDRH